MDGTEEEVYAGELPDEIEGEGDGMDTKDGAGDADSAELEAMKARLKEMEDEAAKLRQVQAKAEKEIAGSDVNREEADARSVYIGNVDYATTPEELQMHFEQCGTVNRVTILTDAEGNPKGFAYLEFLEPEAVANALSQNGSELRGRQIKVSAKRTNVPGMKVRGRGGRGRGGRGGGFPGAAGGMPFDPWGGAGYFGFPPMGMAPMMAAMMGAGGRFGSPYGRGRGGRGRGRGRAAAF